MGPTTAPPGWARPAPTRSWNAPPEPAPASPPQLRAPVGGAVARRSRVLGSGGPWPLQLH